MKNNKKFVETAKECKILCIGEEPGIDTYKDDLCDTYAVTTAKTLTEGLAHIDEDSMDLVIEAMAIDDISQIKSADPSIDVIHVLAERNPEIILDAARAGASGYLVTPFAAEELFAVLEMIRRNKNVRDRYDTLLMPDFEQNNNQLIGQSPAFMDVVAHAVKLKGHKAGVLITGESGTGKEMLARFIHELEGDPKRPFVAINCAAIPDTLMESELFGHEKGSFTGATQRKLGKFELANNGDIFLDEISSLKPELQAKILRVLEDKMTCRIGNNAPIKLDFRVIAASNDNLEQLVKEKLFRMDLYHRLKVVEFRMPPLRERIDDIQILVEHFLHKHNKPPHAKIILEDALELLKSYSWPGNIRELENLIQNLIIMAPNGTIEANDIPPHITNATYNHIESNLNKYLSDVKKTQIKETLAKTNGNKSDTARILGISRTTINKLLDDEDS